MTAAQVDDRLLDHYAARLAAKGDPRYGATCEEVRSRLDADPAWQSRLGRTDGAYGYLRALCIAGIATPQERSDLAEFGG